MKSGSARGQPLVAEHHHRLWDVELDHRHRAGRLDLDHRRQRRPLRRQAAEQAVEQRPELGGGDRAGHRHRQPVPGQRPGVGGAQVFDRLGARPPPPSRRAAGHRGGRQTARRRTRAWRCGRGRSRRRAAAPAAAPRTRSTASGSNRGASSASRSSSTLASRFSASISAETVTPSIPASNPKPGGQILARLGEGGGVAHPRPLLEQGGHQRGRRPPGPEGRARFRRRSSHRAR